MDTFVPSAEATAQGVCHTEAECLELYKGLDPGRRQAAINYLQNVFIRDPEFLSRAQTALQKYGSREWTKHYMDDGLEKYNNDPILKAKLSGLCDFRFTQGLWLRNVLRGGGFGEDELGIHNLECVYLYLVEEALRG